MSICLLLVWAHHLLEGVRFAYQVTRDAHFGSDSFGIFLAATISDFSLFSKEYCSLSGRGSKSRSHMNK